MLCLKKRHMHLSRWGGSNIAAKLNKSIFSETLNSFIALIVGTHVSHTQWLQLPVLHQEINKPHALSASVNRVVRYWLLPLLTETTEQEDQGMTATLLALPWFPSSSKPSINFWLKCKFPLIDTSSNMRQHTRSPSDIVCWLRMGIDARLIAKC